MVDATSEAVILSLIEARAGMLGLTQVGSEGDEVIVYRSGETRSGKRSQPRASSSSITNFGGFSFILNRTKENTMANPFVHVELNTTDLNTAKSFYGKLFGWKLEDMPMPQGSYTTIDVGEGTGGGMMKQMIPGAPSAWLPYVSVDDIQAATKKAESLGATVMKDVTAVEDMGWFSIITDPTGAVLGLWKAKT